MAKRICAVCGTEYGYCPTCDADRHKPTWMMTFHDQNCHDIWETLCAISCKTISEEEGADKLRRLDLTDMNKFAPNLRKQISAVLETRKAAERSSEKIKKGKKSIF